MADERKCHAGDLGTDQIGRFVKVMTDGAVVVQDRLVAVMHSSHQSSVMPASPVVTTEGWEPRTWVQLEHVAPQDSMQFGPWGNGFEVRSDSEVTVLP